MLCNMSAQYVPRQKKRLTNYERTTSEMRGPSFRIQIRWFSTKRECSKHTYETLKTIISLTIKLLQFSLKITRLRRRGCFKR
jgi:hypothetical protein